MENKKIFIGNLDFAATEAELKSLLSKFGSVISVRMKQKKGYAFIEMENAEEAAQAVAQLDGTKHKDREIRLSFYMNARKARTVSVRQYKDRGVSLFKQRKETSTKPEKDLIQDQFSSPGRQVADSRTPSSSRSQKQKSGYKPRERSSGSESRPFKSSSRERTGSARPPKRSWSAEKPSYPRSPARDDQKSGSARSPRSESGFKPRERSSGSESRPFKAPSHKRTGPPRSQKKEWSSPGPSRPLGNTGGSRAERPERKKTFGSKPRDSSQPRSPGTSQNRFSKPSQPGIARGKKSSVSSKPQTRSNASVRGKSSRKTDR